MQISRKKKNKIDALIRSAVAVANNEVAKAVKKRETDIFSTDNLWNVIYHVEMDRSAKEAGLRV